MRWRYGDTNPVVAAVDAETVIEIGDMVAQLNDRTLPASAWGAVGPAFASLFLGIAMQRSRAGETAPIRVATTGVFEFECDASRFQLGELVKPRPDGARNGLESQAIAKSESPDLAIGRVAKREPVSNISVLVAILSTVMNGGVLGST
jgi:hypothetical protein